MTYIIAWPLFYVTTVASKFPLARLRYKTSTCNEQRVLLDVACFCKYNEHTPVSKKRPNFLNTRQLAQRARYGYWAHLTAGFDNQLPFAPFRYEH